MWRLFIFLMLIMFKAEASFPDNDSMHISEIQFKIEYKIDGKNSFQTICDHNDTSYPLTYTVLEGEAFKISVKYNKCKDYFDNTRTYDHYEQEHRHEVYTFIADKWMSTLWNCTLLSHRDFQPYTHTRAVLYKGYTYKATHCYMRIHVRQTESPQTILVNNMALQAVRTDLSEKDVDFTAEYQYVDGDVVNVACVNFLGTGSLTMEYPMADTLSDKFTSVNLSSSQAIGFATKLHPGHNNSHMICTARETSDYTKVMVRFVMQTELNIVLIKLNGLTLRPKLYNAVNNDYIIEYKYISDLPIKVVCEVKRTDMVLVVTDLVNGFADKVRDYKKSELIPSKKTEMSFRLNGENTTLACCSDNLTGGQSTELNTIKFSMGNFPIEQHPLHMELPPNGTVMELFDYNDDKSRKVIIYEFEDGEKLQLKCGPLPVIPLPAPVLCLQFKDSQCSHDGCYITESLTVTDQHDNSEIVCRLKEMYPVREDNVLSEIRVILRKRVLTTTTTPTTTMVQPTDDACVNKIDSLKIKILEEELKYQQEIHKEELKIKLKEREHKEKMWDLELKIKEIELGKLE